MEVLYWQVPNEEITAYQDMVPRVKPGHKASSIYNGSSNKHHETRLLLRKRETLYLFHKKCKGSKWKLTQLKVSSAVTVTKLNKPLCELYNRSGKTCLQV